MTAHLPSDPVLRMPVMRRLPLLVLALVLAFPARRERREASAKTLYKDGPEGRYLLDGDWLFRLDNDDQGDHAALHAQHVDGGLEHGQGPERVEPRRRLERVDDRRDRLVPQGLRAARRGLARSTWALRFESVNYRTRVWLNGRPIGENTGAYIPFELRRERPQAPRDEPARGARRLAPARPRLPAGAPEHRRRARPAAGGTTRASSARSTCASSTRSTSSASRCARRSPAAPARERARAGQPAQRHARRPARDGHRQVRRPDAAAWAPRGSARRDRVVHGHAADQASRGCGRRRPRTSTTSPSPSARAAGRSPATRSTAASARSRSRSGRLVLNGQSLNLRGVGLHEDSKAAGLRDRQRAPRAAGQRGQGARARRCCARTTRCTRTRTSWPTGSGC